MEAFVLVDNALNSSIAYSLLALSVFISLRRSDFPDLSIEGTFPLGACISIILATHHLSFLSLPIAMVAGFVMGCITGILFNYLHIGKLLSGILVAVGLYSVNYRVLGANANLFVLNSDNPFGYLRNIDQKMIQSMLGADSTKLLYPMSNLVLVSVLLLMLIAILYFFRTQLGFCVAHSKSSNRMLYEAYGLDHKKYQIISLGLANSLAALAGGIVGFQSGSASISMGFGIILTALVSLVIGERIVRFIHTDFTDIFPNILAPFVGSFVYTIMIKLIRTLNTKLQEVYGYPDPTSQFQFFTSDVNVLSALILVLVYITYAKQSKQQPFMEQL